MYLAPTYTPQEEALAQRLFEQRKAALPRRLRATRFFIGFERDYCLSVARAQLAEEAIAAQLIGKIQLSQRDLIARLSPHDRSVRINQIRNELTVLQYATFRYDTTQRNRDLNYELSLLEEVENA